MQRLGNGWCANRYPGSMQYSVRWGLNFYRCAKLNVRRCILPYVQRWALPKVPLLPLLLFINGLIPIVALYTIWQSSNFHLQFSITGCKGRLSGAVVKCKTFPVKDVSSSPVDNWNCFLHFNSVNSPLYISLSVCLPVCLSCLSVCRLTTYLPHRFLCFFVCFSAWVSLSVLPVCTSVFQKSQK